MLQLLSFLLLMNLSHAPTTGGGAPNAAYEDFRIYLADAEVYDSSPSSLKLKSVSSSYQLKLEPTTEGQVTFTLGRYGFRTNMRTNGLAFGARIVGYKDSSIVTPTLHVEDDHPDITLHNGRVIFQSLDRPVPVSFSSNVDSIMLTFSNNHGLDVHQYLSLDDLQIVHQQKVVSNPKLSSEASRTVMFGIEGSSAHDKQARKIISKHLLNHFKQPVATLESDTICIMEFTTEVKSLTQSAEPKAIAKQLKAIKKNTPKKKTASAHVNWLVALEQAIERQPDLFILVTSRWSNHQDGGHTSFFAQHEDLVEKCNALKEQGTRILLITSGLTDDIASHRVLYGLLNHHDTKSVRGADLINRGQIIADLDLIALEKMEDFTLIDFSTLY